MRVRAGSSPTRSRRDSVALLTAAVCIAAASFYPSTARAAEIYDVYVGHPLPAAGAGAESTRFFPSSIRVHRGDILSFQSAGFHTATLLPLGAAPGEWLGANAERDGEWSVLSADADSGSGALKLNNAVVTQTDGGCGGQGQTACSYAGEEVVHSGLPLQYLLRFAVSVDAPVGSTFWAVDLVDTSMRMRITVVEDSEEPSRPARLDDQRRRTLDDDLSEAQRLRRTHSRPSKLRTRNGVTWRVYAGLGSARVTVPGFFPRSLTIKRGQSVRWEFGAPGSAHSVTFPRSFAQNVEDAMPIFHCDLDGSGSDPDAPAQLMEPPYCENPEQLELDLPMDALRRVGNGTKGGGVDVESSGLRGGPFGPRSPYTIRFDTRKRAGFVYSDISSPSLTGKVVVR